MRTTTLLAISTGISVLLVLISGGILQYYDYTGRASFIVNSPLISGAVLTPVIVAILTPINLKLLAWRKAEGRDIAEEEKYESASGMIGLTRRNGD